MFQPKAHVFFATLDPSSKRLKTALKLLDFTEMIFFMCVRDVYRSMVDEIIKEENLHVVFDDDSTVMKFLTKEDAKKFSTEYKTVWTFYEFY